MPDLQKLKVILLERHQEPVHIFLCKMGVAQYIKVDCEEESYNGFLQACSIPKDESLKNSDIQTRIKRKFEELDLKPDDVIDEVALLPGNTIKEILFNMEQTASDVYKRQVIDEVALLPGNTIKEILFNMEQKLTEIEKQPNPIIELLDLDSTLVKKTLQKLQEWKVSPKKLITKDKPPVRRQTSEELLSDVKHNLTDINNQLEETAKQVLELQSSEYSEERSIKEIPELGTIHSTLSALQGMTLEVDVLLEAENNMAHCDTIVYFEAWILKKQLPKVIEGIAPSLVVGRI